MVDPITIQASVVAIGTRALALEGPPGSGKSSLALALLDRGAELIGDDGVTLQRQGDLLMAGPPPNIAGKIEIRGVGIAQMPVASPAPLAMILSLSEQSERLPETIRTRELLGVHVPCLPFTPGAIAPALRAEWALRMHGLNAA